MPYSRLTLSNRQENLKLLLDFIKTWAQERSLAAPRRASLEQAAREIFQHLLTQAYHPGQPGSISVVLEEKGPRLRLVFEDDGAPHNPLRFIGPQAPDAPEQPDCNSGPGSLQVTAESLLYYRTGDHKNRLVVFLA
jgi:anti-sigma regulatory factor (Ser/Thr protein kinase)